jgi:hypothetical protein
VLRIYCVGDPAFLSFVANFFKAGVELNLALTKFVELHQLFDTVEQERPDNKPAIRKAALCSRWYHYQYIKLVSAAYLAQFALYWDSQVTKGFWPRRPGREAMPELNLFNPSDRHLQVSSLGKADNGPQAHWPHNFTQWSNFEQLLSFVDDPSFIPWFRDSTSRYYQTTADISWNFGISPPVVQVSNSSPSATPNPRRDSPPHKLATHRRGRKHCHGQGFHNYRGSNKQHHIRHSPTPVSSPCAYSASIASSPRSDSSSRYPTNPHHPKSPKHTRKRRHRYGFQQSLPASCIKPRPANYRSNKRVRFASPSHSSTNYNSADTALPRWKKRNISSTHHPSTEFVNVNT